MILRYAESPCCGETFIFIDKKYKREKDVYIGLIDGKIPFFIEDTLLKQLKNVNFLRYLQIEHKKQFMTDHLSFSFISERYNWILEENLIEEK